MPDWNELSELPALLAAADKRIKELETERDTAKAEAIQIAGELRAEQRAHDFAESHRKAAADKQIAELQHQLQEANHVNAVLAIDNAGLRKELGETVAQYQDIPIEAIVVLGTPMGSNNTRACLLALSQLSQYVAEHNLQGMDLSTYVERRMALEPEEDKEQYG